MPKPIPESQRADPRTFQIKQIETRFKATKSDSPSSRDQDGATVLSFAMKPSDPDFPFDLNALRCSLTVPSRYPDKNQGPGSRPTLSIENEEMARGYQINVERGFDALWEGGAAKASKMTLLDAMKALDRRLEDLLTAQRAQTIKIIGNSNAAATPSSASQALREKRSAVSTKGSHSVDAQSSSVHAPQPALSVPRSSHAMPQPPRPSQQRVQQGQEKRLSETSTLENRFGRLINFSRDTPDSSIYTIPIEPRKRESLPPEMRVVKALRLYVPTGYDIDPCSMEIVGVVEGEAKSAVEKAFAERAERKREETLMAHVNFLSQNMSKMVSDGMKLVEQEKAAQGFRDMTIEPQTDDAHESISEQEEPKDRFERITEKDKSHIKIIPRPPEWTIPGSDDEHSDLDDDLSDNSLMSDMSEDTEESSLGEEHHNHAGNSTSAINNAITPRETGILTTFPSLSLRGVELLELHSLSLTVKCTRCKTQADLRNIRPVDVGSLSASHPAVNTKSPSASTTCRKCALLLSASFRPSILHQSDNRAGYIDPINCTPLAILISTFKPTCSTCSTTFPAPPGVVAASGLDEALAICRECYARISFSTGEVKFLNVGGASRETQADAGKTVGRKKNEKLELGIVVGSELPSRGRCSHYRKSQRWFRFSCCGGLYPCDKCHDEAVGFTKPSGATGSTGNALPSAATASENTGPHPNDQATRMVCGFCSREQPFHPFSCKHCHSGLTGRPVGQGKGFWEGGTGTRDPARMSRKEKRKWRNKGGTRRRERGTKAS